MAKRKNTTSTRVIQAGYNFGLKLYELAIRIAALKSEKAKLWLDGRRNWKEELKEISKIEQPKILLHAASLGEMEQGRPILEKLRREFPHHFILVSFFSPSGYLNFKGDGICDAVIYLPIDRPKNARFFAQTLRPSIGLFIKYEIWPNLLKEFASVQCKSFLAPAQFRANQIYFKPIIGGFFRQALARFSHIHVQTQSSQQLLSQWGFRAHSLVGDSRFDRAMQISKAAFDSAEMELFRAKHQTLIVGSSWPKEEAMALELLKKEKALKLILAPHDVSAENIARILKQFGDFKLIRYSNKKHNPEARVLLVDGIGQLKYLYRFADFVLIGGGFGKGVHSTVEAAVYKIPIAFGPNHQKFPETLELIEQGFGRCVHDFEEFQSFYETYQKQIPQFEERYDKYLKAKLGASEKIVQDIKNKTLNAE